MADPCGRNQVVVVEWVLARGAHAVRTGLQDNFRVDRTHLAASNAELVKLAVDRLARHGRTPASPAQARAMLGLADAA